MSAHRRTHRRQLTPHNVAELCQMNVVAPQPLQVPVMMTATVAKDHSASLASFTFPKRRPVPALVTRPRRDSCSEQAVAAVHRMRVSVHTSHSAANPRRGSLLVAPCV